MDGSPTTTRRPTSPSALVASPVRRESDRAAGSMEHRHEGTERRISPVVERSNQLLRRPPHEATDSAPGPLTRRPAGRTPPPRQDPPLAAFGEEARRDAAAHGAAAASDSMRRRGERAHAPISATINPAPIHACRSSAAGRCAHASKAGRGCCVACIEASKPRRTPRVRSMPCPSIGLGRLAACHCYCYGHSTSRDAGVGLHPPTTVMRPSNQGVVGEKNLGFGTVHVSLLLYK